MPVLRSRDNPRVRRWANLVADTRLRRREGRAMIEGPHLVEAMLQASLEPLSLLVSESGLRNGEIENLIRRSAVAPVLLSDAVFRWMADSESPPGIAAEIALPDTRLPQAGDCVFLEGVQDSGNVGAIVRSAAAFGAAAVVLDRACADAWSPRALRAGMGGHFRLAVLQCRCLDELIDDLRIELVCTVAEGGLSLDDLDFRGEERRGWIFGSEGRGVSAALLQRASVKVTIPTAPGTQSLNVAAAAAICLSRGFSRPGGRS